MSEIDFIEIHDKSDRDLLVAVITRQNMMLEAQHKTNDNLEKINGTVAKVVTECEKNKTRGTLNTRLAIFAICLAISLGISGSTGVLAEVAHKAIAFIP